MGNASFFMIIKVECFFGSNSQKSTTYKRDIAMIFQPLHKNIRIMKAVRLVTIFFLLMSIKCYSQGIQWASEVVDHSKQLRKTDYSYREILGKPDAEPYGRKSFNAFLINTDSTKRSITLVFENPQHVSRVIIVENYFPGQIRKVSLYDTEGKLHDIYESPRQIISQKSNVLTIKIDKTPYKVQKVEVRLIAFINIGTSQIDAVGICEEMCKWEMISDISKRGLPYSFTGNSKIRKEILGGNVNTAYNESKPVISPDGELLYFVRKNAPNNVGNIKDDQDIYFSELIDGTWSDAQNIGFPLNDKLANGVCSVGPDGNTLMVINAYYDDGSVEKGFSISRKTETGWSIPKKNEIEDYYNISEYEDYYQSITGEVLISAVERVDSKGDQDLYISFKTGENSWSPPENMGDVINTIKEDFSPFLASDNKTLYFSSAGHPGYGESDIFYSLRLDDSWTNWSVPVNLGESVNTSAWDGYYTISAKGDYAYFVSTIEKIIDAKLAPINENIYRISYSKEARTDPAALINGSVINPVTTKPVLPEIINKSAPLKAKEGKVNSDPNTGDNKIVSGTNEDITMRDEFTETSKNLDLASLMVDQTIHLKKILFVLNEDELLPESLPELERLLFLLNEKPSLEIELHGHTDSQGSSAANLKLSELRALAIVNYLSQNGIDKNRLGFTGYGDTRPVTDSDSLESRKKNQRVEIKIINI